MGVNFSAFEIGRRALHANQIGIAVTGQNIANVNTPGYSRQRVLLSPSPSDGSKVRLAGNGVTVDGVRAARDQFIESRLQTETGITGRLEAKRDALSPLDAVFNDSTTNGGIQSALVGFFGAFRDLETRPTSVPLRVAVTSNAETLTAAFHGTRSRLVDIRAGADNALRSTVDDVNTLAQKAADLNVQIRLIENTGGSASDLIDQRSETIRQLSELTGARAIETDDGLVTLTLGDGRALVAGGQAFSLAAASTPPDGLATLTLDGQPVSITDGKIRGLQEAIGEIGAHITSLDQLAESLSARVNTLHASGSDLDGNNGTNFFATPVSGPVTAANIDISATIKADPRLVVAASSGAGSGDATIARGLAGLLQDKTSVVGTETVSYESFYAALVTEAGRGIRSTDDALTTQQLILAQTQAQRDSVSSVSLDEEAINLLQYQKAYEAAARFLKVADEMTQTILSLAQ